MTKAALERLVRVWQGRMGLDAWELKVEWSGAEPGTDATVVPDGNYEQAVLQFGEAWPAWDDVKAARVVVHELVHLWVRGVDNVVADAREVMHPQGAAQVEKRYEHEREALIEGIARRIVELAS